MDAVDRRKKGEIQMEYTIKLNLIVRLHIWITEQEHYILCRLFSQVQWVLHGVSMKLVPTPCKYSQEWQTKNQNCIQLWS